MLGETYRCGKHDGFFLQDAEVSLGEAPPESHEFLGDLVERVLAADLDSA